MKIVMRIAILAVIAGLAVLGARYFGFGVKKPLPPRVVSAIGGNWNDQLGATYTFTDKAGVLTVIGNNGMRIIHGTGRVTGQTFTVALTNTVDTITVRCSGGRVNAGQLTADCTDSIGHRYDWHLRHFGM